MSYFGFATRATDALNIVRSGNLKNLKLMLLTSEELNNIRDDNNDNLLHLATHAENVEMVEYLLSKGLNYNSPNKFGKSPWDLAVMIRNKHIIQKYVTHMGKALCGHTTEIILLQSALEKEKEVGRSNINRLKELNSGLSFENSELRRGNKRLRDDNEELTQCNKRLRTDNDELTQSNKKLKISVETLMQNSKKK